MPHVLCLRPVHPEALAQLRAHPGVTVEVMENVTPENLAPVLPYTEAVIVRATRIDEAFLSMAPELRIVARHGVGYDAVDVPALTKRGIPLTVTPDANAVSVAEHAMMMLLSVARRVKDYDAATRALDWGPRESLPTFDLAGRTLLVVGFIAITTLAFLLLGAAPTTLRIRFDDSAAVKSAFGGRPSRAQSAANIS